MDDETIMHHGRFDGEKLGDVPTRYLEYLLIMDLELGELRTYIEDRLKRERNCYEIDRKN